ncbi:MAG TPA: M20/M25/M40 family metallo-hydrolase [Thermoanaerobaculia bacterium]|nr:M20/M25/M40 family metallo-hydrolase [Thermoanaerobaculia bacterium]
MDPMTGALPEAIFRDTLDLLRELTAISSDSGDAEGLHRAAEHLAGALRQRGLAAEIRDEPSAEAGRPLPVLQARGPETSRGHLLLIGHLDTVLPAAEPRLDGGRLIATGGIDMKGGLATLAGALDLLRHRGQAPPPDLLLVVVPDEEVGGELSRAAVQRWGETARALWVLEPGEPSGDAETIVAGRRGMFQWRLEARGQAAHSGLHYWEGRSALAAAARWAVEAEALSRRGGPTINVGRLVAGDATFVDDLAASAGLLGTERQLNVVPDRAVAEGETRFLRAIQSDELARALEAIARDVAVETGTSLAFGVGQLIPPVDPYGPQTAWTRRAVDLAADRGWQLEVETERGGISFPNFLPDPGRIPVLDGLGPVGGGMHTREEYVDLRSLGRRIVLLADLLAAEGGA